MGSAAQRRASRRGERGQAAVAFVAAVPVLVAITLALLQLTLAGHATLNAANAARAAARADYVGAGVERAARQALPPSLREGAAVAVGDASVEVELEVPRALPVGPPIAVSASSRLGPADGVPGG
jgi:hypothetical protein